MKKRWLRDYFREIIQTLTQYKSRSIIVRTSAFVLLVTLVPFLLVTTMVRMEMNSVVKEEITVANERTLDAIATSLDNVMDKMFSLSVHLIDSTGLASFNLLDWDFALRQYGEALEDKISLNLLLEEYMDSVYIYVSGREKVLSVERGTDGIRTLPLEQMADTSWKPLYDQHAAASNMVFCSRLERDMYPYLLTLIRPVRIAHNEPAGAVVINIDIRKLSQYLGIHDLKEARFYMLGQDGILLYSNRENLFEEPYAQSQLAELLYDQQGELKETTQVDGENYNVVGAVSQRYSFQYILCNSNTDYENKIQAVDNFVWHMVILLCLLGFVLSCIVALHFFFPVQRIVNVVGALEADAEESAEEEEADAFKGDQEWDNEFRYIETKIRQAKRREGRKLHETEEWFGKLKEAQLLALQNQINPHYLYNTLESISSMAVTQAGYDNQVSDMITDLADFFRIGMRKDNYLVSVAEEMEHARLYLRIIEVRYAGAVQVHWDIEEAVLHCKVLSLTLQPLIENAIQHGLRKKRYQGHITISGIQKDEIIYLTVEDDGVGMEQSECAALNEELLKQYEQVCDHVGIRNVNQRIKILFGEDYGICVNSKEEGGLAVHVTLPVLA